MFACAIIANVSYGMGILIRSYTLNDLLVSAPWLLGSLGVVALDVVISCQVPKAGDAHDMAWQEPAVWICNCLHAQYQ